MHCATAQSRYAILMSLGSALHRCWTCLQEVEKGVACAAQHVGDFVHAHAAQRCLWTCWAI